MLLGVRLCELGDELKCDLCVEFGGGWREWRDVLRAAGIKINLLRMVDIFNII